MNQNKVYKKILFLALILLTQACSTVKSILGTGQKDQTQPPIQNPFHDYSQYGSGREEAIILRSKKGDRSVEVELPGSTGDLSNLEMPVSPQFNDQTSHHDNDEYGIQKRPPGIADKEIVRTFPKGSLDQEVDKSQVERTLGVVPAENDTPESDTSYLQAIDHIKRLFKNARFEAALLETDQLLRAYPTDPKIYEMRGTLFDRIGKPDLAFKNWNQALRLDPSNHSLKRFLDRKQQRRSLSSSQFEDTESKQDRSKTP